GGADAAEPAAVNAPDDDGDDDAEADAADGDEDAAEGDEEDADEKDADADGERRGNGNNGKDNENKGKDNNGNGNNNNGNNNNGGDEDNNGLDVLGRDCSNSDLEPHNGFQEAPRCVDTAFGEVASEEKSPSLLITESPETVKAGEEFTITVSTRNLIRDRFLGAAAGGYYLESSFLNEDGIQRGHFHTACRMLESTSEAPDAEPEPEFFLATQDNEGGEGPDFVEITVSGMPTA